MSLIDYVNRKYDYLSFQNVRPAGDAKLGLELFNSKSNGQICVGVQKLSQRWLLEFMTELGSMPGLPERGTNFVSAVRRGLINNAVAAASAFTIESMLVQRNLQNEEYEDMPDDERLSGAELLSVSFLPSYLRMGIKINSIAGTAREVILPISTLPTSDV